MKTLILFISLMCLFITSKGQSITNELIGSAGGSFPTMDWSVGEVMTETFVSAEIILTQGFHQDVFSSETNTENISYPKDDFLLYPNPAIDKMYLKINTRNFEDSNLQLIMLDITGQVIYRDNSLSEMNYINIHNITEGFYIIKILSNENIIKTFKIIKQ